MTRELSRVAAVAAVLALAGWLVLGASGAPRVPTKGRCAGAWNATGPKSVLGSQPVRKAFVTNVLLFGGRDTLIKGGASRSTTHQGPGCLVVFQLSHGRLTETGRWNGRTVARWRRLPGGPAAANACVAPDRTLHHVGAATRC